MDTFYDALRITIHNTLSPESEETVNGIIRAIQYASFDSLSDLQLVQEKDLMCILKPIPRRKLIKAFNKLSMVEDLNYEYERMKIEAVSRQIDEFLAEAKNSFESTLNPVKMESITELLKTNICRILDSVSEETLDNIIHALNDAGLEILLDLQFVREDDLPQVLPLFQQKKLIKAWSQQGILLRFSSPSTVVHEQITVGHNTCEDSSAMSSLSPTNANSSISYSSMLAQRQASVGSSCMDTSQAPSNHLSPYKDQTYGASLLEPSPRISSLNDHCPLAPGPLTGLASNGSESIPPVNLYNLMFKNSKWNFKICFALLKVYVKHKKELSRPSVKQKQKVWRKIAQEVHQLSVCSRCFKGGGKCSFFSGSECMDKIEILRLQYHANKNENVLKGGMAKFFHASRNAFESTEDSGTAFTELPSCVYLPRFKWVFKKRLALLRAYTIFKQELSSSNINKQSVWKKIAVKVGRNDPHCDAKQCHNKICDMKCEYEGMKHSKPYELSRSQSVFLDEAENVFENIENPVVFSLQSNLEKWAMKKKHRVALLEIFTKYEAELLLQNFDVERQVVWGKLAREVSKRCSHYYGKRLCCYEINRLKRHQKINEEFIRTPWVFYEEEEALESTECAGQHEEVNSLKDIIVKKEKRGWYEQINI